MGTSRLMLIATLAAVSIATLVSYLTFGAIRDGNPAVVTAVGVQTGFWGIVLALGGFGVTWVQLQRTESATRSVATALGKLKKDFASVDVVEEVRSARDTIASLKDELIDQRWRTAAQGFERLRSNLVFAVSAENTLSDQITEKLKDSLAFVSDASVSMNFVASERLINSIDSMVHKLQDLDNILIEAGIHIRSNFGV